MRPNREFTTVLGTTMMLAVGLAVGVASPASAASNATYDAAVMADNPRYYWSLDETSGAVRDRMGRAAASDVTTAQLGVAGAAGTAASFDGVGQQVRVPYTAGMRMPASFSAEVWAKLPAAPQATGWPTVFSRGDVSPGRFGAAMWVSTDSRRTVHFKRNGYDVGTSRGLSSTAYRHIVFSFDGVTKRWTFYVDGTVDTTGVAAGLAGADVESAPLQIGAMLASATAAPVNFGRLLIDGLALYPSALPAGRVAAHYAAAVKPAATTPQPAASYVGGVALGAVQPWNPRRAADYQAIGAANATWVRSDLGWQYLEPVKGDWRFGTFDPVIADAKANGMRYLAILHTVPGWANGDTGDYGLATDPALLTNYCYRTAQHYIPLGVTDYEIGNEINLPHPGWTPSGAVYARKYLAPCVAGVRRAAAELGTATNIVFGALAPTDWTGGTDPFTFLTDAYANGAGGLFDAFGWHPYTGSDTPATSPHMNSDVTRLNAIMAANGDGAKKIWATEYGLPTGGPNSFTEQTQASDLASAFDVWNAKPFAGPMFYYSHRDTGTSSTDREQHFGVMRHDGTQKPAYGVLKSKLRR